MASLTSLIATHGPVLLVDAASTCAQVGLVWGPGEAHWWQASREAGIAIFEGAAAVLAAAGLEIGGIGALGFCEGPGSILGIRTAAMALRTWRATAARPVAVFAYRSLPLVALDLARAGTPLPFAVIADARRRTWHTVEGASAPDSLPVKRIPTPDLAAYAGELYLPSGFRTWETPPRPAHVVPYALEDLWRRQAAADLLHPAKDPDAFLHEDISYAAWTPAVHRAPRSQAV